MADNNNDWIRKAFEKAADDTPFDDPEEELEFQAYHRRIIQDSDVVIQACGMYVGLDKMNALSKVVIESGNVGTLSAFVKNLVTIGFHIGYNEGRKAK